MTKTISIGDALMTGFELIRRRPLDVWVWGALTASPLLLFFWMILNMVGAIPLAEMAGDTPDPQFLLAFARVQALSGLVNILQLVVYVVVVGAVCRAVLKPDAPRGRFFGLKIGMDEARVAVTLVAIVVAFYAAAFLIVLLAFAFGALLWMASEAAAVGLGIVAGLAGLVAVVWLGLRACLIIPASVALDDFAFVQGWSLTRGHVAHLLGLAAATVAVVILVQILVMAAAVIVALGLGLAFWPHIQAWGDAIDGGAALAINWPLAIGASLLVFPFAAAFYGAMTAISTAPYAAACGQLLAAKGEDAPSDREVS
ncbi:hypothetical protein D8I30_12865 [Brevundimonas naejangsanensis]|uniref:Glycerophosphoryl diester phosphodiesterase membrane domain-containing protein n=1 Tax=Brevundimonas naejangsanensis TaxID=588932 RepID=A0A494RRY3_9CAUL|nr:hypothetical protein [Brevundimonas naejangsanensis]AYG95966.1 hypothetical protein D8I30_12865 [Brevundimonas naejangsanensis]